MSRPALSFSALDLSQPADFLLALRCAEHFPDPAPIIPDQWGRDLETVEELHHFVFKSRKGRQVVAATLVLLEKLANVVVIDDRQLPNIPPEWLHVFAEAFDRGLINRLALGAAINRILLIRPDLAQGPYAPTQQKVVAYLRQSSPMGLMLPTERYHWRALPETVTIYRGGCASLAEAANTVHWSRTEDIAAMYMRARSYQRGDDPTAGSPVIVRADVPRSAVLAWRLTHQEVWVDFEQITPEMVTHINPMVHAPLAPRTVSLRLSNMGRVFAGI